MLSCQYMKQFMRSIIFLLLLGGSCWAATSTLNTDGSWSTATNWTPSGVPGSTVDAVINGAKYANVSTNVGSIKTLTLGNSSAEGAINMKAGGVLKVSNGINVCVVVGGPGIADTEVFPYPSYYSHVDGDFSTTGDMVIGTNSLSGQAFFNQGNLSVGGCLRVGAQTSGVSQFKVNGAGSGVSSLGASRLEVGSRGKLTFDYRKEVRTNGVVVYGSAVLPISVTNQVNLSSGSTLVITNATALQAGTYKLINGGSLSGTFSTTNISGLPPYMSGQIQYDTANGDVNLVVSGAIVAEFDNYYADGFWSTQDNWTPFYPDGTSFGRLLAFVQVTSPVEIGYLEIGTAQANYGLNLWDPAGSLTLNRPKESLIVGVANNGSSYPNYYSHAAGSLTTVGDMILGANSGTVEASFSSGSIQVGGTLRLGSYQNSGAAVFEIRGGGGTIGAHDLEVGDAGKLVFDYIGGASLKTVNVTGQASILSGAKLSIKNTSSSPAAINPTTYTLVQAASIVGTFSQVDFSGFPSSVVPRIVYSGGQIQLVVESSSGGAVLDAGTSRLSGYSQVALLGAAGYSFGSAADGEDVYYSDFSAGTITRVSGGVSTTLKTDLTGIYGLAVKGNKMYYGREYDANPDTAKVFEITKSGTTWGDPREVLAGITRPRQIFIESTGSLLLAVETAGQILRVNPATGTSTALAIGLYAPQAAVSDSAGNVYFNEYGSTTEDGTPTITGKLWKIPVGSSSKTLLMEGRRLRGLALIPGSPDQLVQLTEANNGDQGSSSTTTILTTSGTLIRTIEGIDYPQFTGVTASGNVVTTCPRDEALLSILPNNSSGSDSAFVLRSGVDCFASVRGLAYQGSGSGRFPVTVTGMKDGSLTFYVFPDSSGKFAGWIRMTKTQWPNISTSELVSRPGYYALPQPGIQTSGNVDRIQILPHRSRNVSRWPMTNVGTAQEAPQAGFSEAPDAYLAYIEVSGLAPTISWDGGGSDASWSTAANWSGDVLPGASDNVLANAGVYVTSAVRPVGNVVVGNASGNGALNMVSPGSLTATSLTIGAANNSGSGTGYPNYFRGNGGNITTTRDFVIGANGAKIDGSYTWGDITVGGALKIGAGYSDPGGSTLLLRGASSTITSGSLTIGGGVKLIMDFIGGTSMRTLTSTGAVTLESGASIEIVGNSTIVAGNNRRLIDGAPGGLSGTFSNVTFEGFSSNVVPSLVYNSTDGDVWLVISTRTISWDAGGGADQKWSTVTNWNGDVLPGSGDDVLLNGGVQVTTAVGPVGNVVVGNASGNGSLNMILPGSLSATSLTIGAANNTGGGTGYPNYFYGNGGNITTTGDFVIGANGAKIDGSYTWGDITVGGALKIGAGYSDPGGSTLLLRGAASTITSGSLTIGGGVKLIMDFIGGTSMRTLTSTGAVTLESGASIEIVGNSTIVAGNNRRLIDGAPGGLSGTFSNVTFEGFSSNVVPSLVYNSTDGDVWLVISTRTISWDAGGGADQKWSTVTNWNGDVLPGSGDDVLLNGGVQVTTAVGPVGNVVVGNASGNGSLNMILPGSLSATSLTIGAANNTGGGTGYPNYFYGNGGNITTTGDFVIGASGAKIDGTYTWGDIIVGGALKIGAGYSDPSGSSLSLRGAASKIESGSLTIGGGVKLIMDYNGGTSMRTLKSTGAVTLESGSSIKIVGNSSIAVGDNPRLIDGGAGLLRGTFSNVTFEGFSSSVVPSLAYNNTDGDVWLVLTSAGTTFASWSGSATPADSSTLMKYGVGGATSLTAASEKMLTTVDASNLSITAIVRIDDTKLSVVGQSVTSLSGSWSNLATNPTGTVSSDQSGVPTGCQRRIFSVSKGVNSKMFLRLVVTLSN